MASRHKFVWVAALVLSSTLLLHHAAPAQQQAPAAVEWTGDFTGNALDESKWERFTFQGGSGGTFKVENGELQMRGVPESRSGVRSKQKFSGDRFIAEATVAKVGPAQPEPNRPGLPPGYADLAVLFDDSGRNRLEWILTSDGVFEAWSVQNGQASRLDNHRLGTKMPKPTLGIVRRGDQVMFMLNGEVGMQQTIKNLPHDFWLMLYGFGTSENNWTSARVVTLKQ
jgi:hypothetical protein